MAHDAGKRSTIGVVQLKNLSAADTGCFNRDDNFAVGRHRVGNVAQFEGRWSGEDERSHAGGLPVLFEMDVAALSTFVDNEPSLGEQLYDADHLRELLNAIDVFSQADHRRVPAQKDVGGFGIE